MKPAGAVLIGVLLCGGSTAAGQAVPPATGRIEGSVIVSQGMTGLPGALVTLVPTAVAAQPRDDGSQALLRH